MIGLVDFIAGCFTHGSATKQTVELLISEIIIICRCTVHTALGCYEYFKRQMRHEILKP